MKNRTFLAFVGPSLFLMFLFIAGPLMSVAWQSVHVTRAVYEEVETEVCTPGFLKQKCNWKYVNRLPFCTSCVVPW